MIRRAFIYLLHFDRPIAGHAQHYIGCTEQLEARLHTHANGGGSALTKHLYACGINWQLAALAECNFQTMRRLERRLKDLANSPQYCPLCTPNPKPIPGTRGFALSLLPFPLHSRNYRTDMPDVILADASNAADLAPFKASIRRIMKDQAGALGFVPIGGERGLDVLFNTGRIVLAIAGTRLVGYTAWSRLPVQPRTRIHQCVTIDAYRFQGIGRRMVEHIAAKHPENTLTCWVRNDLAANHFWTACGFIHTTTKTHKTSNSTLNHYERKPLCTSSTATEPLTNPKTENELSSPTSTPKSRKKPATTTETPTNLSSPSKAPTPPERSSRRSSSKRKTSPE